jgi:hypothetical protein
MARVVHFTAAGFKPQLIEVAPEGEELESKRSHIIDEEDKNLNRNLGELEEGTRARNREILRRLVSRSPSPPLEVISINRMKFGVKPQPGKRRWSLRKRNLRRASFISKSASFSLSSSLTVIPTAERIREASAEV